MNLKRLELNNFRNHESLNLDFNDRINILVGKNASGKTNILEAIFFLTTTKSHRTSLSKELIKQDCSSFHIKGEAERNGCSVILETGCPRAGKKTIKINNQPVRARRDVVGQIPVVFFSPEDLYLVKEDPSFRRRFLNILISQVNQRYLVGLQKYQRIISERNKALSEVKDGRLDSEVLDVWDEQAVKTGIEIISKRREVILRLNDICAELHREITGGGEAITLEYKASADSEEGYRKKLKEKRRAEIEQGVTFTGPHRDDMLMYLNGMNLRRFGSQGQQRTAALSLKLGELRLMKEILGEFPLILFDDVMSELDNARREFFLGILNRTGTGGGGMQSFITTTELDVFKSIVEVANVIKL